MSSKNNGFYKTVGMGLVGILLGGLFYGCQVEKTSSKDTKYREIVSDIIEAQNDLKTIPSLSKSYPSLTVDEAYEIQDILATEIAKKNGPVAGYKIGYADSNALKKNNLDIPAYGPFFKNQLLKNGGNVPLKDFIKFAIENEIIFKIGKDVDKNCNTIDEIKTYIESIHLGFDMSETVFKSPSGAQDFIAGGAGSKYFMIGEGLDPDEVDLENVTLTIEFKDKIVYDGSSKNVYGNPWNVMLAVSNDLYKRGKPLKKGYLIFSGKAAPAYKIKLVDATGTFTGTGSPFQPVTCNTH